MNLINSIRTVFEEHIKNIYMILRLSAYELKNNYADSLLGIVWVFLNPTLQIIVYAVVFGTGIRGGAPVGDIPFFAWMICGLIPWFFISQSIMQGSNAVYARINTVAKMNFPLSITPTYAIMAQFYTHLILVLLMIIVVIIMVGITQIHLFVLLYFLLANLVFLVSLSLVTSTLSTMARDIHLLIQSITRMLLYLTPVLWEPNPNSNPILVTLMRINPFYYTVEGYRAALIYNDPGYIFTGYSIYFWCVTLFFLVVGCLLHIKFRKQFIDYL